MSDTDTQATATPPFEQILEQAPDAIIFADREGAIRLWNSAAARLFGHAAAEVLGENLDLIIPERLRARHWAGWKSAMRTGYTSYAEGQMLAVPALRKGGRQISIEFSIQLLRGTNDEIEWIVAIIRDVTERYTRDKALRAELRALQLKT